jgi:hypothetical protein
MEILKISRGSNTITCIYHLFQKLSSECLSLSIERKKKKNKIKKKKEKEEVGVCN